MSVFDLKRHFDDVKLCIIST